MEHRTPKYKIYSSVMYLSIYLLIVAFPFNEILNHDWHYLILTIGKIILSIVMIILFRRDGFTFEMFNWKNSLLYIQLIVLCGSNLVFLALNNASFATNPPYLHLVNSFCYCLATALAEEMIFRGMAVDIVKAKFNKLLTILITALIFGLVHLVAGIFSNPLGALIQAGYTFFLGLVVGFAYVFDGGIYVAVAIHFLFNFLNDGLFPILYDGNWNTLFYIVNISVGAAAAIYLAIIYLLKYSKNSAKSKEKPAN